MSLRTYSLAALVAITLLMAPLTVVAQPGAQSPFAPRQAGIAHWADRLASELEYLLEDVRIDTNRRGQREIYRDIDQLIRDVTHFQRAARSNPGAEHLYRDFQAMDRDLHNLLERVRAIGGGAGALSRDVARVQYADQQLHYAISQGSLGQDGNSDRWKEVVARQAHVLESESQRLLQAARYALSNNPGGQQIQAAIGQFAQEAGHFHEAYERGAERDHVRRDYLGVQRSWQQVVNALNNLGRGENYYLRRQADRVDSILANLHQALRVEGQRPSYSY